MKHVLTMIAVAVWAASLLAVEQATGRNILYDIPQVEENISRTFNLPVLTVRQRLNGKWRGACSYLPLSVSVTESREPLRISFSDDTPGGSGATIRNSLWMAALNAALQKESALQGIRISLDFKGGMDGPSAGAMMCLGIMTALDGRDFPDDFAMTGTILPDGTIGNVGGVPEKMKAAARNPKIKRVAIPAFQRFDCDNNGNWTDLYELGRRLGMEVHPVESIGDAYIFLHQAASRSEQMVSALSVCRESPDFEKSVADIFQKRNAALRERLFSLPSNTLAVVRHGWEWREINPATAERRFMEGAIFDALNMTARADAHLSAYLESWNFYNDFYDNFMKKADADKGFFSTSLKDKKMHEWPIDKQLAYVDGFREQIKEVCEKSLGWRKDRNAADDNKSNKDDDEPWRGLVPDAGSSDLSAQLLSMVDACRAEGQYRYMDSQTFDRAELEAALKSGKRDIYEEIEYDRKKLFFLMSEKFIRADLQNVPLPILNCGAEVSSALELFRKAWLITDTNIETDIVDSLAQSAALHRDDVRRRLMRKHLDYAVYDAAKGLGTFILRLYDEAKGDGVEFQYPGWTDSNLMFLCADLFAESSAQLLKLDNSEDNATFMAFVTDRARITAIKSMDVCRKAGIPCFAAVLAFQKAERGRSAMTQDPTAVLANYWKATMSSKALVMAFKNGVGSAQGASGYAERPEEIAARESMKAILEFSLNAEIEPLLDSMPSSWTKALSDVAAVVAQNTDDETWNAIVNVIRQAGVLCINRWKEVSEWSAEANGVTNMLPEADTHASYDNLGGRLLGFAATATRESIAKGELIKALQAPKLWPGEEILGKKLSTMSASEYNQVVSDMQVKIESSGFDNKHKAEIDRLMKEGKLDDAISYYFKCKNKTPKWRSVALPTIEAHMKSDRTVEVSMPDLKESSDIFTCMLGEDSLSFKMHDGKMVVSDLIPLFEDCATWSTDVEKAIVELGPDGMKSFVPIFEALAASLEKAAKCSDMTSFKAAFDSLDLSMLLPEGKGENQK